MIVVLEEVEGVDGEAAVVVEVEVGELEVVVGADVVG